MEPSRLDISYSLLPSFNPPGGFGAFGTRVKLTVYGLRYSFNPPGGFGAFGTCTLLCTDLSFEVSIRRADLGLLEPQPDCTISPRSLMFQSAGRIWGFWNSVHFWNGLYPRFVSIRRADLGLLERLRRCRLRLMGRCFNPPGGFGAFGTFFAQRGD